LTELLLATPLTCLGSFIGAIVAASGYVAEDQEVEEKVL